MNWIGIGKFDIFVWKMANLKQFGNVNKAAKWYNF